LAGSDSLFDPFVHLYTGTLSSGEGVLDATTNAAKVALVRAQSVVMATIVAGLCILMGGGFRLFSSVRTIMAQYGERVGESQDEPELLPVAWQFNRRCHP
jgi:hypothetical protein